MVCCFGVLWPSGGLLTNSAVYKTHLCCDLCAQAACISMPAWACCGIVSVRGVQLLYTHSCTVHYSTSQLSLCLATLAQKKRNMPPS